MKQMKRITSILLVLSLFLALLPADTATARAAVTTLGSHYADGDGNLISSASSKGRVSLLKSTPVTDSQSELLDNFFTNPYAAATITAGVSYLRQQMKLHNETIFFTVTNEAYEEGVEAAIYKRALQHTGVGDEGMYLCSTIKQAFIHAYEYQGVVVYVYQLRYRTTLEEELMATQMIQELEEAMEWASYGNERDYIMPIYNWIREHVTYDQESFDKHASGQDDHVSDQSYTAYAALTQGKAVCLGIATLMYHVLLDKGVSCYVVSSDTHAWNAVEVNGKWYECDATWDLTTEYRNPQYLLLSHKKMSQLSDHQWMSTMYDYDAIQSLNWAKDNYHTFTNFVIESVNNLTYSKQNKGKAKIVVKDENGNKLTEGVDYTLTYNNRWDGTGTGALIGRIWYTVTPINETHVEPVTGYYESELGIPKITKIERQTKKEKGYTYVRFKITCKKVYGAEEYEAHAYSTNKYITNNGECIIFKRSASNCIYSEWTKVLKGWNADAPTKACYFSVTARGEKVVLLTGAVVHRGHSKEACASLPKNKNKIVNPKNMYRDF